MRRACSRACAKTGKRIAARIAMIAITTRSSMRVKPRGARRCVDVMADLVLSTEKERKRWSADAPEMEGDANDMKRFNSPAQMIRPVEAGCQGQSDGISV